MGDEATKALSRWRVGERPNADKLNEPVDLLNRFGVDPPEQIDPGIPDFFGPSTATDCAIALFDGDSGIRLKDSFVIIDPVANTLTFDNPTTTTGFGFSVDGQLNLLVDEAIEIAFTTRQMSFLDDESQFHGFFWGTPSQVDFFIDLVIEMTLSETNLEFNNPTTTTSIGWSNSGQLDFLVSGSQEMSMIANRLTFNNGAVDTALGWGTSGILDFLIAGSNELRLGANILTFVDGALNMSLQWNVPGQLAVVLSALIEVRFQTDVVRFKNNTAIDYSSPSTLALFGQTTVSMELSSGAQKFFGPGGVINMTVVDNILSFNNGAVGTGFEWSVSGKLFFTVGGFVDMVLEDNSLTFLEQPGGDAARFSWVNNRLDMRDGNSDLIVASILNGAFEIVRDLRHIGSEIGFFNISAGSVTQNPNIPDATGGVGHVDTQARTTIASILDLIERYGLMAT